jgi:pilus assembly protein Flp/PilA
MLERRLPQHSKHARPFARRLGRTPSQEDRFMAHALLRDRSGQGLPEYALILALVAVVAIVALLFLGTQISTILSTIGAAL